MRNSVPTVREVRDALQRTRKNGECKITAAAVLVNVARSTLSHRLNGRNPVTERRVRPFSRSDIGISPICAC